MTQEMYVRDKNTREPVPFIVSRGQAHNRRITSANITYASATNSCTWPAANNITNLIVMPFANSASDRHYDAFNMIGAATTTHITGSGTLGQITINQPIANGTITIYDNTAASGTVIGKITLPAVLLEQGPHTATYDAEFSLGLTVVTVGAAMDITISAEKNQPTALFVLNAPSDAVATVWLSEAGGPTIDVQYYPVFRDKPWEIQSTDAIIRLDVLPYIQNLPIFIGAN